MSKTVHWLLEVSIKDGQLDGFKELMGEMVARTHDTEPGTLIYDWLISEDGKVCHLYERYSDSPAVMAHLTSFGRYFADRFIAMTEPKNLFVYGDPSDEVKEGLAAFNPTFMKPIGGFAR